MAMPSTDPIRVTSEYGPGNVLTTRMPREGIDIGPPPDFWGDFERMLSRVKPRPRAQASALREPRAPMVPMQAPYEAHEQIAPEEAYSGYTGTFGVPYMDVQAKGGSLYQPWSPEQRFSPMYPPVFTGWWRR